MAQEMMTLRDAMAFAYFAGGSATVLTQKSPMRRTATAGQETQDVNLLKSGVRFSLKAATPSFDSGVS
jgi:hypothetical protein